MNVIINQKTYTLNENSKLVDIFTILQMESQAGIAVAVNGKLVTKRDWQNYQLKDGDNILLVKATPGG